MTIEFLHEHHADKEHHAMVQLSRQFSGGAIREKFAALTHHDVTFHKLKSHTMNPPETFQMTAAEADAFVEAWQAFKANTAEWLQFEAWTKEQEAKAEMERQAGMWKEIEQLAASIPGLEILAREDERWDEDTEEYVPSQCWTVKHHNVGYSDSYIYNVDEVLTSAQSAIDHYNQRLADCEEGEKENYWYGWHPIAKENAQKFLATHRAFMAHKTAPLVEQQA